MIPIVEIFDSVQGEIDVGVPSTFVRVAGCDMKPLCTYCDSKHAWTSSESKNYTVEQLVKALKKHTMPQIVWTGGSPSLYFPEIRQCIDELNDHTHSLETNGLVFDVNMVAFFDRISVSPKRQNVNMDALKEFASLPQTRFKFIYEPKKSFWWEKIVKKLEIDPGKVYIMPLGADKEEHLGNAFEAIEYCKKTGFTFAPRIHVMLWGNKRKV